MGHISRVPQKKHPKGEKKNTKSHNNNVNFDWMEKNTYSPLIGKNVKSE